MNEFNKLIKNENKSDYSWKQNINNDNIFISKKLAFKLIFWLVLLIFFFILLIPNIADILKDNSKDIEKFLTNANIKNFSEEMKTKIDKLIYKISRDDELKCKNLDPIYLFENRLNDSQEILCKSENSSHICYKNKMFIFASKNGLICKMENFTINPSKWEDTGFIYKSPIDLKKNGTPKITKGFFRMKCNIKNQIDYYDRNYNEYINSWDYNYDDNEKNEELSPGKTIFFLSRNQDSPNLFHGGSEFINAFSLMVLLNLNPENIQIVFLESIDFKDNDPFYDLYKYVISAGNAPIHIKTLKKKYHISSAIHIPINWDSPCFIESWILNYCKNPSKTYYLLNNYIQKYMNIPNYTDFFITDNETYYYPKTMNKLYEYKKYVTIQWRKDWTKGRRRQHRILGNGPELAEALASQMPKDILIRLVDTSRLSMREQISIMKKTDYFVGIHGAGFFLSIFLPTNSIVHELLPWSNMKGLVLMSRLSGHKTYSDLLKAYKNIINENEYIFFDCDDFTQKIFQRMKENNF